MLLPLRRGTVGLLLTDFVFSGIPASFFL